MAYTFMCFIEEKLESKNELPQERKHGRHVNRGKGHSNSFSFPSNAKLTGEAHPSISFTMKVADS